MAKAKIAIAFYSSYGHIKTMAQEVAKGIEAAGCEAHLFQFRETLPAEVRQKMYIPDQDPSITIMDASNVEKLVEYDGILFGIPTRFGTMPAQIKAVLDATGGMWMAGKLAGKPAGTFFSTAQQGGGQETTALTFVPFLAHHGMIYVPTGFGPGANNMEEIHGGSAYGAGTLANGDGSRQPSELEKNLAVNQGKTFALTAAAFKAGRA
eukprot:GDKI01035542.1.p2 GENE.GDKI01035542.1~~GDKI01035542.1.p2  ORF type:complete len:208 (+),score=90.03 GDKI01035542.1:73-696(+)